MEAVLFGGVGIGGGWVDLWVGGPQAEADTAAPAACLAPACMLRLWRTQPCSASSWSVPPLQYTHAPTHQVLFCTLSPEQRDLYRGYLASKDLGQIFAGHRAALAGIDILRKICNVRGLRE